jgi:TctA family transporter
LLLLVLNLPFIGLWVRLLSVPYKVLFPSVLLFSCIGVFSLNNEPLDVVFAAAFGVAGYVFLKLGCEAAPLLLGLILGPMVEENLRRSLQLSRGDPTIFLTRPISLVFLIAGLCLVLLVVVPSLRRNRQTRESR